MMHLNIEMNEAMIRITDSDLKMIEALRSHGRISVSDLAKKLGVSRSTAQKRLERLETSGVIESYTCLLSPEYRRRWVSAHILVTLAPKSMDSVVASLADVAGVEEIHSVSGEYDLIVVLSAPSVTSVEISVDEVIAITGVERTRTSIILSTRLKRQP